MVDKNVEIFECPQCKAKLNVADIPDGKKGKCPSCKNIIVIRRQKVHDIITDKILQRVMLKLEEDIKEIKDSLRSFAKNEFTLLHSRFDDLVMKSSQRINVLIEGSNKNIEDFIRQAREELPKIESLFKNIIEQFIINSKKELEHHFKIFQKELSDSLSSLETRYQTSITDLETRYFQADKRLEKSISVSQKNIQEMKESLTADSIKYKESLDKEFIRLQNELVARFSEQSKIIKESFEELGEKTYKDLSQKLTAFLNNISHEISYEFGIPHEGLLEVGSEEHLPLFEISGAISETEQSSEGSSRSQEKEESEKIG
ncbi:MAG: hypothetical protein AB1765_03940 [Candidatus Hydrogenedentota bacterium]